MPVVAAGRDGGHPATGAAGSAGRWGFSTWSRLPGPPHATWAFTGRGHGRVSGLVAAHAAWAVTGGVGAGVRHIEQVPALADLPERLAVHGVALHPGEDGAQR